MKGRLGGWQKLKILMVNKFLFPNGGSETYMFEVGKQLQKKGHEVQYFGMEHGNRVVGNRVVIRPIWIFIRGNGTKSFTRSESFIPGQPGRS